MLFSHNDGVPPSLPPCKRYPNLVKSIASVFSCSDVIGGERYLLADLTVVCYAGWHVFFLICAALGAAVYAIGIPVAVAAATAFRSPVQRNEAGGLACVRCARRDETEYATGRLRSRYAFLYNGYATDRSGVVVAWEALVMLRKLAVALAGSLLRDPYLQILVALFVLVVSFGATAYVQPYETSWLNLLDTLGLFTLIMTQILSIVYFYTQTALYPFMDPDALEIIVTVLLFLLNAAALIAFAACFASELFGIRTRCAARRRDVLAVASLEQVRAAMRAGAAGGGEAPTQLWGHPSGIAVARPPKQDTLGVWVWRDVDGSVAASVDEPQLLLRLGDNQTLAPGATFRTMDKVTHALTKEETQLNDDVGGCGSERADVEPPFLGGARRDDFAMELAANRGFELVERRGRGAADCGAQGVVAGVAIGGDTNADERGAPADRASEHVIAELTAENAELKAEIMRLSEQHVGPERALAVVERDDGDAVNVVDSDGAPQAKLAPMETAETPSAEDEVWYYTDPLDARTTHGPYSLLQLKEWCDDGHFSDAMDAFTDEEAGAEVALRTAFYRAGLLPDDESWFYDDDVDAMKQHGPFTLLRLNEWLEEGHFCDTDLVRDSPTGAPVSLADALVGLG